MNLDPQAAWRERGRVARAAAAALPQEVAWTKAISRWWLELPSQERTSPTTPVEVPHDIVAATPGGEELVRSVNAVVTRAQRDPKYDVAAVLVGRGLAKAAAVLPASLEAFQGAALFCADARDDFGSFESAFADECRADPMKFGDWLQMLTESAANLKSFDLDSRGAALIEHERVRDAGDYREVWRRHGWDEWYRPQVVSQFQVLLALDASAFARAIDRVPHHGLRKALMEFIELREGADFGAHLLAVAPPTATPDGKWNGSSFALMLLDTPVRYAQREILSGRFGQFGPSAVTNSSEDKQALKNLFHRFFSVAEGRDDARFLMLAFALEVARRAAHPRALRVVTWTLEEVMLDQVIESVERIGFSVTDVKADWASRVRPAVTTESAFPHLLVGGCLWAAKSFTDEPTQSVRSGVDPRATAGEIWSWYTEVLQASDADAAGQLNPYGEAAKWVFATPALALASLTDPVGEVGRAWALLYEQRFRGRMALDDRDAALPSLHLLKVARHCLEWLLGGAALRVADSERSRALWMFLHGIAIQLFGNIPHDHFRKDRDVLAALYAFVPHVFPREWRSVLSADGPLLASDDILCIIAAANVANNGVEASEVKSCMRGAGCDPVLAGKALQMYVSRVEQRDQAINNALKLLEKMQ